MPVPKIIAPEDRLIFALDVPSPEEAKELVRELGPAVTFYKVGMELFMAGGYWELVEWLREQGKSVFVDLKLFDVPKTVERAVSRIAGRGVSFATVHGNDAMLEAAARAARDSDLKVLAVTVLTSLDRGDMDDLGFAVDIPDLVLSRARRALDLGCDGVISSGLEAPALRGELGERLMIVCPGIRPGDNRPADDQKRTVDIEEAFAGGADHIVIGRPIRDAPDRRAAAEAVQRRIADHFTSP